MTGAREVAAAPAGPYERAASRQVTSALRQVAAGYDRAAGAARRGDKGAYNAAGRSVRRGGTALRRALAALAGLGYAAGK